MIPIRDRRAAVPEVPPVPAALRPRRLPSAGLRYLAWTPDRVELLSRMWTDGKPVSEIVTALDCGASRNAVIGKAHRLGLARRPNPIGRTHD